MLLRLLLTLYFLLLSISLQADTISENSWGFSFKNPSGWKYQKDMDGALLGHDHIAGLIMLFAHELKNKKALEIEMQKGLTEDDGYLRLQGSLKKMGKNGFTGEYTGMYQMQQVKARGYGTLSPYGGGAIIIVMSTPSTFSSQLTSAGRAIAKSIKYKKIDNSDLLKKFIGKWSTYSKYSESHLYLYPDGTYSDSRASNYGNSDASVGAVWGMANDSSAKGR